LKANKLKLGDWYQNAKIYLEQDRDEPTSSILALAGHILKSSPAFILAHPERALTAFEIDELTRMLDRLKSGEPLAYIIKRQAFFGMDFYVDPSVLIPRPETEILVEQALSWLRHKDIYTVALEAGTGSACIPISICMNFQKVSFFTFEISTNAIQIAKINISNFRLTDQIQLIKTNSCSCFKPGFNLICANLPYIPTERLESLQVSKFEPGIALDGGKDGLFIIKEFLSQSSFLLQNPGLLLCEIDYTQKDSLIQLSHELFHDASISIVNDLSKFSRVLRIETGAH